MDTRRMRIDGAWTAPWGIGRLLRALNLLAVSRRNDDFVVVHLPSTEEHTMSVCQASRWNGTLTASGQREGGAPLVKVPQRHGVNGSLTRTWGVHPQRTQRVEPAVVLEIEDHVLAFCRGCGRRHLVTGASDFCVICVGQERVDRATLTNRPESTIRQGQSRRIARAIAPAWPEALSLH